MDTLILEKLEFFGHHGCFEEERQQGQTFWVTLRLGLNTRPAAVADDLSLTVDCGALYELARDEAEKHCYQLIETLAEKIAGRILFAFPRVERVAVRVDKPRAPGPDSVFHSAVEIERSRS